MPDLHSELSSKALVMVVGPAAIGKSSIMHAASKQDSRFAYVRSFTTRPARTGETSTYQHVTTEEALRLQADGHTVTFFHHPTTNQIYGTTVESYPGEYNLLDTLSGSVDVYRSIPFNKTITISLTADPDVWETWLSKRFSIGSSERTARLREAVSSIEWSLAQTNDHFWLVNQPGDITHTAAQLIAIAEGQSTKGHTPHQAVALLDRAKHLLTYDEKATA